MSGPTQDWAQIEAEARPGSAFSNGSEWESWSANWCQRCVHDQDQDSGGCPLVVFAMVEDKTPAAWVPGATDAQGRESLADRYGCLDFKPVES